jgi:cytochrome c oxidase subunit II
MTLIEKLVVLGLIAGLATCALPASTPAAEGAQVVKITASRFHFTPDHVTLVKGQPVTLQLTSTDATHGFLIRALKIDTDIKPGKVTEMTVTPAEAGTFKAICDHYCGLGHGGMKMTIMVEDHVANAKTPRASSIASK